MTDLLTQRLQDTTERLPIALRSAGTVRRDARRYARRRNGAVAAVAAASVVVVIGISASLAGDRNAAPPPAESPTPTTSRATISLDRFLTPADLPAAAPFATWTGAATSRDMNGQPYCVSMASGDPVGSRLREFQSETTGVRGYQVVAEYPTVTLARSAALAARDSIDKCTLRMGRTESVEQQGHFPDESGFHVLRTESPASTVELVVYGWSGRLASVVWLVADDDPTPVAADGPETLLGRMLTRVDGGVPDEPPTDPAASLAAALLNADDIAGGSARQDDISEQFDEAPEAFRPLHRCGYTDSSEPMRHRTFSGAGGQQFAGQRVQIGIDAESAANNYATMLQGIERCDGDTDHQPDVVLERDAVDLGNLGDDAVAWRFLLKTAGNTTPAVSYVALVRVGSVVTEIALHGREEPGLDPGARALVATVERAMTRIRTALPEGSAG
jgi:hypothetical protein